MNASERRKAVMEYLEAAQEPIPASKLAEKLSVSRQIIVGDVALLRMGGAVITATPKGYVLGTEQAGIRRTIACCHNTEQMETEMNMIVDNGCTVEDVVVEHPIYGQLAGRLQIQNRYDVAQFVEQVSAQDAKPLSVLTNGIHIHTILCPDENAYQRVLSKLRAAGILVDDAV